MNGGTCSVSKEWETLEPKAYYTEFCRAKSICLDGIWPERYYEVNVTFSEMFENLDPTNCAAKFVVSSSSYSDGYKFDDDKFFKKLYIKINNDNGGQVRLEISGTYT